MNKDNHIEQMAKDMCEYYYEGTCYQDKKPCDCKCDIFTDAQYLYAKGYRKFSDVAREIFAEIENVLKIVNIPCINEEGCITPLQASYWAIYPMILPNSKRNTKARDKSWEIRL